jgi:hypothetical protein
MVSEKAKRSYSLAIAAAKSFSGIVKKTKKTFLHDTTIESLIHWLPPKHITMSSTQQSSHLCLTITRVHHKSDALQNTISSDYCSTIKNQRYIETYQNQRI